ncbi:MAG: flagellar motor stator protein MotA [Paracoccaceae bacterium]
MLGVIGIAVVFVMVFGGYLGAGGKLSIILHSLPFELTMIGGAAVGALFISNDFQAVKHTLRDIGTVFRGPAWKKQDYHDLLVLLFNLIRIGRDNPMALEEHIESPDTSALFAAAPRIAADREVVELICDTLRSASMNYDDPHQVEEVLDKRIEARQTHAEHSGHALQTMADGLPALGIVAAVLGVIKTMSSIDKPPEILGKSIGSALVGTFLGVFLAYGLIGPFATKLQSVTAQDQHFYLLVREVLVAYLHRHPPVICVEVGRQNLPAPLRPSFADVEEALRGQKQEMAA